MGIKANGRFLREQGGNRENDDRRISQTQGRGQRDRRVGGVRGAEVRMDEHDHTDQSHFNASPEDCPDSCAVQESGASPPAGGCVAGPTGARPRRPAAAEMLAAASLRRSRRRAAAAANASAATGTIAPTGSAGGWHRQLPDPAPRPADGPQQASAVSAAASGSSGAGRAHAPVAGAAAPSPSRCAAISWGHSATNSAPAVVSSSTLCMPHATPTTRMPVSRASRTSPAVSVTSTVLAAIRHGVPAGLVVARPRSAGRTRCPSRPGTSGSPPACPGRRRRRRRGRSRRPGRCRRESGAARASRWTT